MKTITKLLSIATFLISFSYTSVFSQISFIVSDTIGCNPLTATFTNTSTVGSSYLIDFGNGASGFLAGTDTTYTYINSGFYQASLFAYDSNGNYIGFDYLYIQVHTRDTSFNMSATTICPGDWVNFHAYTNDTSCTWDFGDGSPQVTGQNYAGHTYSSFGIYDVTLVMNSVCGTDTIIQTITVDSSGVPSGGFGWWPDPVCPGQPVYFYPWNSNGTSYLWDFGDGSGTSTDQNPSHPYINAGTFAVNMTITNGCGNSTTNTDSIRVQNDAGIDPNIQLFPNSPACPGEEMHTNTYGGYLAYVWSAGDGSPIDSSNNDGFNHVYNLTGVYTQSCKVYDYCGNDTTIYTQVVISDTLSFPNNPLYIQLSADSICPGQSVYINSPYGFASYVYDFGDGQTDSTIWNHQQHTYSNVGTYTISLKLYTFCGEDSTITKDIVVDQNVGFTNVDPLNFNPLNCPGTNVEIQAPGGYKTYVFDFGDSSPKVYSTENDARHIYNFVGGYNISVTIYNHCNDSITINGVVSIQNNLGFPNNIGIYPSHTPSCPGDEVGFDLHGAHGYSSYEWDFGDGNTIITGSGRAEHVYDSIGNYTYSVKITNGCGNDTTLSSGLVVDANAPFPNWLQIETETQIACPGDAVRFNMEVLSGLAYWDFGDGQTLTTTENEISHIYDTVGTFTVSATTWNGCGDSLTLTKSILIDSNNTFVNPTIFSINTTICPGDIFSISSGSESSSYTYYWDMGDGTLDTSIGVGVNHIYDTIGTYKVTAVVTNGCGYSDSSSVIINVTDSALINMNDDFFGTASEEGGVAGCAGDAIIFYFAGSYASNNWDFGDGSSGSATDVISASFGNFSIITHVFQNTGTYWATLTLTNNCGNTFTDSLQFVIGSGLSVDGDLFALPPTGGGAYTTCEGINFLAVGGNSFDWDFGDGNTLTTNSGQSTHNYDSAGTYSTSVNITNACGNSAVLTYPITVIEGGGANVTASQINPLTCNGGNDAIATANVTGGVLPYTYSWNDPNTTSTDTVNGLAAGNYTITVSDNLGCKGTASILITDPPSINGTGSTIPASCSASDGSVSITNLIGGTAPYTFLWDNGDNTATADSLSSGTYTVTVSDANGCFTDTSITLSDSGGVSITSAIITDPICNGGSDGSVDITISGGSLPYTYSWSNGDSIEDISGLKEGTYTITVTDSTGCKTIKSGVVSEPLPIAISTNIVDANCGNSDGSVTISASGGTPGYSYAWSNGVTTSTNAGIVAGAYTVTVSDNNGCSAIYTLSVNNANAPVYTTNVTNVTCNGLSDGGIDLSVSGGTTPYTYLWLHNGSFTQDVSGLPANSYTMLLWDGGGCQSAGTFTITEPDPLAIDITTTAEHCGSSDGSVSAIVTGGTTPYDYSWSNSGTSSSETGLIAGSYTLTLTDTNGCMEAASATISAVAGPTAIISDSSMITCFGYNNGDAIVLASGGTGAYTYNWDDPDMQTNAQATGLGPGTYTVTVADSTGCTDSASVNISEPAELIAIITDSTNIACANTNTGSATVSVSGGTLPYTYSWQNGDTGTFADSLPFGPVDVQVIDNNGCTSFDVVDLSEADMLMLSWTETHISCAGGSDGNIDLTVAGGTTPYYYLWSNSATTEDLSGLPAGQYNLILTDTNGCQDSSVMVTLTEPTPLALSSSAIDAHCGHTNGSVSVVVTGGVIPYTYAWDDPGAQTNSNATGLPADTYHLIVTDSNGCIANDSIEVGTFVDTIPICVVTVDTITSTMNEIVWDKPSPAMGIESFNVYRDVIGTYTLVGNVPFDSLSRFQDTTNNIDPNITSYRYKIAAVDSCGNESAKSSFHESIHLVITDNLPTSVSLVWDSYIGVGFSHYNILRDSTGTEDWQQIDQVTNSNFTYTDISPPQTNSLRYRVDVKMANVCVASKIKNYNSSKSNTSYSLNNKDQMTAVTSVVDTDEDSCNGSATITISNGTPPFTYLWSDGSNQTTATAIDLCAGTYNVTVYDADGDSLVESVTIGTIPAPIGISEFNLDEFLVIYPNPNSGRFNLQFKIAVNEPILITIYSLHGKLVLSEMLEFMNNKFTKEYDLKEFGPGIYYLKTTSSVATTIKKVVIQ